MSVRKKRDDIEATSEEFRTTQREFAGYADDFAADVETKRDVSEYHAAFETFETEIAEARDVFVQYNDTFDAAVAAVLQDVSQRQDDIAALRAAFERYQDTFDADVSELQDVNHLLMAIEEFQTAITETGAEFDAYAEAFDADVAQIQDIDDLLTAIDSVEDAFDDVEEAFDAYSTAFAVDVDAIHADVAAEKEAFEAVTDAFESYQSEFHTVEVQALIDAVGAFESDIEDFSTEFEVTAEEFATYVETFYGMSDTESDAEIKSESEQTEQVEVNTVGDEGNVSRAEAEFETTSASAESITEDDISTSEDTTENIDIDAESESDTTTDTTELTIDTPDGMVTCRVCGEHYHAITEPHLQTHGMSIQDYRAEYGEDVPLRPDDEIQ